LTLALGVIASIASIIGLIVTFYQIRQSNKEKKGYTITLFSGNGKTKQLKFLYAALAVSLFATYGSTFLQHEEQIPQTLGPRDGSEIRIVLSTRDNLPPDRTEPIIISGKKPKTSDSVYGQNKFIINEQKEPPETISLNTNINIASSEKEINREVVEWYAKENGLEIKNTSQYDEAERLLKARLSGGYWKIIVEGEPLTEEAGNCLQKYCLVRGVDACKVCREKDIILKGG
jgi:hypothetical protein